MTTFNFREPGEFGDGATMRVDQAKPAQVAVDERERVANAIFKVMDVTDDLDWRSAALRYADAALGEID